jgi:ribosomal protein L35
MKTNKSFAKRLRVTRKGKVIARVPGHNHFNAKRSGKEKQHKNRADVFHAALDNTARSRFLPH